MNIIFRPPIIDDLNSIMEIELAGFSKEEAASRLAMAERIQKINDSFILAVDFQETILGYVVGPVIPKRYLSDELFETTVANPQFGGYQSVLSLAVTPHARTLGIGSALLTELQAQAKKQQRDAITLTCLEALIPFYQKNGYLVEGLSDSQHANETWYNLVLDL